MKKLITRIKNRKGAPGIRTFFVASLSASIVLIILISIWAAYIYRSAISEKEATTNWHLDQLELTYDIQYQLQRYNQHWQLILLRGSESEDEYYFHLSRLYKSERVIRNLIKELEETTNPDTPIKNAIQHFVDEFYQLGRGYRKALRAFNDTAANPHIAADTIIKSLNINPGQRIQEVILESKHSRDNAHNSIDKKISRAEIIAISITFTILPIVIVMLYFFSNIWIIKPLRKGMNVASNIANGNLDNTINIKNMTKEAQQLLIALNTMQSNIKANQQILITAKDNAERANLSKSEFLSRMSHELRTPLNAILGFSRLLQLSPDDLSDEQKEYIEDIVNAGTHLLNLIDEILNLSRIERNRLAIEIQQINLYSVIEECVLLTTPQAEERNITIHNQVPDSENIHIYADQLRLKQSFLNLLSNAIKYNKAGGEIFITHERTGHDQVRTLFRDTGIGIAKDKIHLLFEPFERIHTDTTIEGTGIGLTLTKKFIELMDGQIGVDSEYGVGSVFWIDLPCVYPECNN
jgi:signal transduction histidine kinase